VTIIVTLAIVSLKDQNFISFGTRPHRTSGAFLHSKTRRIAAIGLCVLMLIERVETPQ
jgi:hypothetical protein